MAAGGLEIAPDVAAALAAGDPVVALESTLIAHGLPRGRNLDVAHELEAAVRAEGAVPATVAIVAGRARVGLDAGALEALALGGGSPRRACATSRPCSPRGARRRRPWPPPRIWRPARACACSRPAGWAESIADARQTWDESADLVTLASTPITVVCAGVKSILDVGATLERLETLNVCVLGYGTDRFPGFYLSDSGFPAPWRVDSPEEVAAVVRAAAVVGVDRRAIVVANPLPPGEQVDPALHDRVLAEGLAAAEREGVRGGAITPFLLDRLHRETRRRDAGGERDARAPQRRARRADRRRAEPRPMSDLDDLQRRPRCHGP